MRLRILLFILLFLSGTSAQVANQFISRLSYGSQNLFGGARSLAMGGSGLAGATAEQSLYTNPALLHTVKDGVCFGVDMSVEQRDEDRAFPYFDNFGGFVDYGSYVYNSNWYEDINIHAAIKLPEWLPLALGIGMGTNSDFNYDYIEEVRSRDFGDALLAYNTISSEGQLRELRFGVSGQVYDNLWLGMQVNGIWGEVTQISEIDSVDPNSSNIRQVENASFEPDGLPLRLLFGIHYKMNERLSVGATYQLPYEVDFKTDYMIKTQDVTLTRPLNYYSALPTQFSDSEGPFDSTASISTNRNVDYPKSLGVGIEYRFTNLLEARVNADFVYTYWSDFTDDLSSDLRFSDTYTIRFGVEHIFFDQLPFRVGFVHGPLRENRQNTRTVFTTGVGLLLESIQIDLSAGLENLTLNERDIFDDGKYPSYDSRLDKIDRVDLSNFYAMLAVHFNLNLIKL